jgi:hypothetical protein
MNEILFALKDKNIIATELNINEAKSVKKYKL